MSSVPATPVPVLPGARGVAAVARAARLLVADDGPAFWPFPQARPPAAADHPVPSGTGVILATSGSTADPIHVVIGRDALLAAAAAGAAALGPSGHWLTAVPATGAGGLLTVVRAILAGAEPIAWPGLGGAASFTAASFASAGEEVLRRAASDGVPAYVSLVPTQLTRILRSHAAAETLGGFARVLVGGAALSAALRRQAEHAGVHVVSTYGATETCGGVVYDGVPLPGVGITVAPGPDAGPGEIVVSGTTLADGYLDRPELTAERFANGVFHTHDVGEWQQGRLRVLGRADQHVKVGGVLVSLAAVAHELRADPRVLDVAVVARPDAEWGSRPHAFVVLADAAADTTPADELADRVAAQLGTPARPDPVQVVTELPTTDAGKPVLRYGR